MPQFAPDLTRCSASGEVPDHGRGRRRAGEGSKFGTPDGDRGSLGRDFAHLFEVCSRALRLGNPRPAASLLRTYRDEARRLEGKAHRRDDFRAARRKVRRLVDLLAADRGRPHGPGQDAASPFAAVHRRKRRDPLANMGLMLRQADAAVEITTIFEATVRSLMARVRPTDSPRVDIPLATDAPFAGMAPALAHRRHARYLPWVEAHQQIVARKDGRELKAIDLVLSVLVDGTGLGVLEKRHGVRHGTFGPILRRALDDYAGRTSTKERT